MELKAYLTLFRKYLLFLVFCVVLGAIVAILSTNFMPSGYNLTQTQFLASETNTPANQNYRLEDFYAQEKARNFTDTAVAILESGDFQSEVTQEGQTVTVKKLAPQVIRLTTIGKNSQSSKELMARTIDTFNRKFTELNLKQIGSPQEPFFKRSSRKVYAVAGATLGLAIAVIVISLKTYFRL